MRGQTAPTILTVGMLKLDDIAEWHDIKPPPGQPGDLVNLKAPVDPADGQEWGKTVSGWWWFREDLVALKVES